MNIIDVNSFIFIFLSTLQMNGTSVISPVSNTLNQLFSQIVESIPKVIAAAIILLIGYIIGRVVGWAIKKVLEKMNFEKTIQKTTLGETVSRSGWSMTKIISTAASWFIYLFFIVAAVNALQFTQLSEALSSIWLWIPNLIAFIIILVIGSIIADFVGNWIQRELPKRGVPAGKAIGMGVKGILYAIIFVTAITQLQIGAGILNMVITALVWGIAAAIAIGLGIALANALKDILPGVVHSTTNIHSTLKPGQKIRFERHSGTIKEVGAFQIILENDEGQTVIIPTKSIIDKDIIVESGPAPETPEKKMQQMVEQAEKKEKNEEGNMTK